MGWRREAGAERREKKTRRVSILCVSQYLPRRFDGTHLREDFGKHLLRHAEGQVADCVERECAWRNEDTKGGGGFFFVVVVEADDLRRCGHPCTPPH